MWDDAGILRNATGLARAESALADLAAEIEAAGVPDRERRYNLTWTDRLNLENMVLVSQAILGAAQARADSRGAHFRTDYPETSALATSHYTVVCQTGGATQVNMEPVQFTIVRPGQTLAHNLACALCGLSLLVALTSGAQAEETRIAQQYGLPYLPLSIMEKQGFMIERGRRQGLTLEPRRMHFTGGRR